MSIYYQNNGIRTQIGGGHFTIYPGSHCILRNKDLDHRAAA